MDGKEEVTDSDTIALCLSGGGYRAMLFHLGRLWRLNELAYLSKLARVSSVSGGSIAAGVLALRWKELSFDRAGVASDFAESGALWRFSKPYMADYKVGQVISPQVELAVAVAATAPDTLPVGPAETRELAATKTRLAKLDRRHQERLVNWGYAACDAAMRTYVVTTAPAPASFPYPEAGE